MRTGPDGAAVEMNSAARRGRHAALRFGRLVMWLVSGALLIVFASYVALPFGLALYIPQLAAQYGIHLDVERVQVEPFESRLKLSGVRIATAGDSSMEWSSIETRVDLAELLSGRLVLDGFRLSESKLHAGGPRSGMTGTVPAAAPAALPEEVSIGELVIDGVELATISETLGRPVTLDWLRISSLDDVFRPDGTEVQADVSIGKGRSKLQGRLNLDATGWILDAEIGANDIPLDGFPALLGADGSWRGRFGGSGPVRLIHSPVNGAFSATTGGRWAVDGLEIRLADAAISGARADWDGAAFMVFTEDVVDALSVDAEVRLRELDVDVVDVLQVEAAELVLRIDASQAPATRLSVAGNSPAVRFSGKGGAFEAIDAEATNLVSQVAFTFADDLGFEVDRLTSSALTAKLPAGRSIDVEQIDIERVVLESNTNAFSVAAATAERIDWRGFTAPQSTGTAARVAVQWIERHEDGGLRLALASVEALEDRNGDSHLRLHDVALDSTTLSPAGAVAAGGVRVTDVRLASEAGTLVLERLSLSGVEQDEGGAVRIASGRAHVVDRALADGRAMVGSGFELAGASVSGRTWEAKHTRLGEVEVETGDASYVLRGLALVDAAGEGGHGSARLVRLGALERGFGGNRIFLEDLVAVSPVWREGAGVSEAIEAASLTLDTVDRHRWQSSGWRLTGVEAATSGRASAETASLENLTLNTADDSTVGAQRIEFGGLGYDGESTMQISSASIEQGHYRTSGGSDVDVTGLRADALQWNGETLAAERGAAALMYVAATPVRASFDTIEFTSARFGAGGVRQIGTLIAAFSRGGAEPMVEWSTGEVELEGYDASATSETMLGLAEAHDVEVSSEANGTRLRTDRLSVRGTRIDPSGATVVANAGVDGVALYDAGGQASTSARAVQAGPLTIRESAVTIGSLDLSGLESTIGVTESGGWELPALPIGPSDAQSSFRVRIDEASTADSGSVMRIVDRTTEPDFTARIDIASAVLRGFDSGAIGVPAPFAVAATSDFFTTLQAGGTVTPLLTGTDLDLNATIHGLSLAELSPYSQLHLGQYVEGGHAGMALDLTVRTSDLEGVADFTLSEVVLGESVSPAGSPALGPADSPALSSASSPSLGSGDSPALGAALALLEDSQGTIKLKVPLRGKVDDPGFDFDGLVIRALANTALETAEALPKAE